MRRRLLWTGIFVILLAAVALPIANAFDHWDTAPGITSDTELQASAVGVICVMCATIGLACSVLFLFTPRRTRLIVVIPRQILSFVAIVRVPPDTSPPPLFQLRI